LFTGFWTEKETKKFTGYYPLHMATDPRVDAYIARVKPFAQPILNRIRAAVHAGCPDVTETIKWSVPAFDYTDARTDETRTRRLATAVEWMAEGKSRNWKYTPGGKK
jgi:hypothetical protein